MLKSTIDHIVLTASSREAGADYVADLLGVRPQQGEGHPRMGTHNALMRLGDAVHLEVIAVKPGARLLRHRAGSILITLQRSIDHIWRSG